MAEMAKFLFDTVFDTSKTAPAPVAARHEKSFWSTDERDAARNEGFERGRQAGIDEINATITARTAAALETIAANVSALTSQLEGQREQLKSEGVILATTIARSLAAALLQREPLHEIEALFSEALNFLPDTPHIAVRLNETVLEAAKEKLDVIAEERGFQGKLILLGQSDIAEGDCRIEWAQGGIVKDHKLIGSKINEITRRHIDAAFLTEEPVISGFDRTTFSSNNTEEISSHPDSLPDQADASDQREEM